MLASFGVSGGDFCIILWYWKNQNAW